MVTLNAVNDEPSAERSGGAIGRAPRGRLSDLLVRSGVVAADAVAEAMQLQDFTGKRLGTILVESGAIDEHQLAAAIAHQAGLPVVDLVESEPSLTAAAAIDGRTAREVQAIPLRISAAHLDVAVANGLPLTRERLEEAARKTVRMYVAPETQIETLLRLVYPQAGDSPEVRAQGLDAADAATLADPVDPVVRVDPVDPVVRVDPVDPVVRVDPVAPAPMDIAPPGRGPERLAQPPARDEGWQRRICDASDALAEVLDLALEADVDTVGIDTSTTGTKIRVQYLSGAHRSLTVPSEVGERLIADAFRAIGQDAQAGRRSGAGQFRPVESDADAVVRVNALPTILGHTLTLRFVRDSTGLQDLGDLGMSPETLESVERGLGFAHGLVVIAGEPGSGRSTTLRAMVRHAIGQDRRAMMLESKQRHLVAGTNQTLLDGLSPHETIHAARGMEVDLIAIDAVADRASARQALAAAMEGNLVVTVLQARTAPDAIELLMRLSAEPAIVASAVRLVLGQAAAEARCADCGHAIDSETLPWTGAGELAEDLLVGACTACTGRSGRKRSVAFDVLEPQGGAHREVAMIDGSPTVDPSVVSRDRFRSATQRFTTDP